MKKNNVVVIVLAVVVLLGAIFTLSLVTDSRNEQAGRDKFNTAISEIRNSKSEYDNPCLGASVLRNYSYSELNKKSVSEIKNLAKNDPGSC